MKTCRLIVAMQLALFPFIFNLSFAEEVMVDIDESSSRTTLSVANGEVKDPGDTPMDSSAVPQNDNNTQENETSMDSTLNTQNDNEDVEEFHPTYVDKIDYSFTDKELSTGDGYIYIVVCEKDGCETVYSTNQYPIKPIN